MYWRTSSSSGGTETKKPGIDSRAFPCYTHFVERVQHGDCSPLHRYCTMFPTSCQDLMGRSKGAILQNDNFAASSPARCSLTHQRGTAWAAENSERKGETPIYFYRRNFAKLILILRTLRTMFFYQALSRLRSTCMALTKRQRGTSI
jgi:hypothetical protein